MIRQNEYGALLKSVSMPIVAGAIHCHTFEADLSAGFTAASDIYEIGVLPANTRIVDADMVSVGLGAGNLIDVGFMSGLPGDDRDARTSGDELFDGVSSNAAHKMTLVNAFAVPKQGQGVSGHAAIGIKLSANEAAGAGKRILVRVFYHA